MRWGEMRLFNRSNTSVVGETKNTPPVRYRDTLSFDDRAVTTSCSIEPHINNNTRALREQEEREKETRRRSIRTCWVVAWSEGRRSIRGNGSRRVDDRRQEVHSLRSQVVDVPFLLIGVSAVQHLLLMRNYDWEEGGTADEQTTTIAIEMAIEDESNQQTFVVRLGSRRPSRTLAGGLGWNNRTEGTWGTSAVALDPWQGSPTHRSSSGRWRYPSGTAWWLTRYSNHTP